MIPILFDSKATSFETNGLGHLTDTVSCKVTEERNGIFELTMEYPVTGIHYEEIALTKLILAQASQDETNRQAFEIYEIKEPINGIATINARHITYRLNYIPVKPFTASGITQTIDGLASNSMETNPFSVVTDITNETSTYNQIEPKSFRSCLGGSEGSLLDVFAGSGTGEYLWDNYTVRFLLHRGQDRGVQLRYAVNITDLENSKSSEDLITGAIAWWHDSDNTIIEYGDAQYSSNASDYPTRTVLIDVSTEMETQPTLSQLNQMAADYVATQGQISQNIKVSFLDLYDIEGKEKADVRLCDTLKVIYMPMGIETSKKVVKTVWNVLLNRYDQIELGTIKSTLAQTIVDNIGDIESIVKENSRIISVVQKVDREMGRVSTTVSQVTEDVNGVLVEMSQLDQTAQMISQTVSQIQGDYVKQSAYNQDAENIQLQFSSVQDSISENKDTLDELQTVITLNADGVTVGKNTSDIRGVFGNESLDFIDSSNTKLAWLSTSEGLGATEVSIGDATTKSKRWRLIVSSDGSHFRITRHS